MKRSEVFFGVARVPLDAVAVTTALLLSYELREANIDLIPGIQLLERATTLPTFDYYLQNFVTPSVLFFLALAAALRLYTLRLTMSSWVEVGRIITASALWLVGIIGWYFLVEKQLFYSRALLLYAVIFIALFVMLGRIALVFFQRALLRAGVGQRLVVSMGSSRPAQSSEATLESDQHYRYLGHLEDLDDLRTLARRHRLDLVVQTDPNPKSDATAQLIEYCRSHHIGYGFLPPVLADVPHQLRVEHLGLLPLIRFQPTRIDGWGRVWKRLFDVTLSVILLIVLSPLLLLIVLLILLTSGLPILYISPRVGDHARKAIAVLKFRTMVRDADEWKEELHVRNYRKDGPLFKVKNDPRVTPIGRLLRRFSLDELPQLFNVLLGHMSLVGPRPHLPEEVQRYSPYQRRVFAVKPGITGLAQVSGRSELTFEEEVRLDLQYIEEWSILLDLWIMVHTVFAVWRRQAD